MKQEEEYKIDYNSPNIPASVKELKPKIYKDGSAWRASSGEDLDGKRNFWSWLYT